MMPRLVQVDDVSAGDWIAPRLAPFGTTLTSVVPRGFEAYARIFHPVEGSPRQDDAVTRPTWRVVTEAMGTVWHPLMQFTGISGLGYDGPTRDPHWGGGRPREGMLARDRLAVLMPLLTAHTGTPDECYAGLWEGYGGIDGQGVEFVALSSSPWERVPVRDEFVHDETGARLTLPNRGYLLFTGPLDLLADPAWAERAHWSQGPNLLWPADRAWFLASEIDFDSTLVGGSQALVDAIVACPGLEAAQVPPDGSLAYDADAFNPTPPLPD